MVLFVAHLFHPVDGLTVELFLHGEVRHDRGRRGAVPMLLTRREPDHVTGPNFPDRASQHCARPQPAVTIKVWPSRWVCQAVRAPGLKVTLAPDARAGAFAGNKGSMRTVGRKKRSADWHRRPSGEHL